MRKPNKYYRGEYVIGIYKKYEDDDSLITLVDNLKEFAEFMGTSLASASMILCKAFNKQIDFIIWNRMKCEICFLNINTIL